MPYTSSAGSTNTANGVVPITIGPTSDITFTAPTGLRVVAQNFVHFDVSSYATDGPYDISCGNISHSLLSFSIPNIEHIGNCIILIRTQSTSGNFNFNMAYSSSGGDTHTGTIQFSPTSAHNTPSVRHIPTQTIGAGNTKVFDASAYASIGGGLSIVCRDAAHISSLFASITRSGCLYTVTAGSTQGSATFRAVIASNSQIAAAHNVTFNIGPSSSIAFTAPAAAFKVGTNRTRDIDVSSYAADGSYAISCGDATSIDTTELMSVTHTGNSCVFTVTPKNVQGTATFTVPYMSAGGTSTDGVITVEVGPASTITYTAPTGLAFVRGTTQTINAGGYATESHSGYAISCGDAKDVSSLLTSVTHTGSSCSFSVVLGSTEGTATFTVPYISEGGHTLDGVVSLTVGPRSFVTFDRRQDKIAGGRATTIDLLTYASDGPYTLTCSTVTTTSPRMSITSQSGCTVTITTLSYLASGPATGTIHLSFRSSGGYVRGVQIVLVFAQNSDITYTAPTGLAVGRNLTRTIDALDYVTENSEWTVSCADATGVAAAKLTVTRSTSGDGCSYTIDPLNTLTPAQQGDTTFTIPYTSTGGDTHNGVVTVYLGPDSDITFTAPTIPVGRNRTVEINALDHLTEGTGFTVTCADATGVDNSKLTSVSHTGDSCTFTVDPVDTLTPAQQGTTTFSVAFTSSGGDTETGAFTVNIGPDSDITFTAPSPKPSVAAGGSATLNVGSYASDGSYTISCGDATSIDSKITSISRTGCSYQVNASSSAAAGDATFTVPYTSSGGHTLNGVVTVAISNITVTTLTGLTVPAGKAIDFDLSGYGSDGDFTITCGDPPPASISVALTSVTRNGCVFTVTGSAIPGSGSFRTTLTSSGGDTHDALISLVVGDIVSLAASGCTDGTFVDTADHPRVTGATNDLVEDCQALVGMQNHWAAVSVNSNLPGNFLRSWGTGTPSQQMIQNWAGITIGSSRVTGLSLPSPLTSTRVSGSIPVQIGLLRALTSLDLNNNALSGSFPTEMGSLTALTSLDLSSNSLRNALPTQIGLLTALTSLDLSGNSFTGSIPTQVGSLTSLTSLDLSSNSFSGAIPTQLGSLAALTSLNLASNRLSGSIPTQLGTITTLATLGICTNYLTGAVPTALRSGVTLTGYPIADGYDSVACQRASDIQYTAPTGLQVTAGSSTTVDASAWATDGNYAITCGNAGNIHTKLSSVNRTGCSYEITARAASTGSATFSITFTSAGGDTHTAVITVAITNLAFTAPTGLVMIEGQTFTIDASSYAVDTGFTVTCGDPVNASVSTKILSVLRTANTCSYAVMAKATAQGDASFDVVFTSSSGDSITGTIPFKISNASFTAPPVRLIVSGQQGTVDALASDPGFTITCGNPTFDSSGNFDRVIKTVGRAIDACHFTFEVKNDVSGAASFSVVFTSSGGSSVTGVFSFTVAQGLLASRCSDGTYVDTTANPAVPANYNDLIDDCQTLVAAQRHWAGSDGYQQLPATHPLKTWGIGVNAKIGDWSGVTVSGRRVTGLDLSTSSGQGIPGTLPTELGNLLALTSLDLSGNLFSGAIPAQLGRLASLTRLDLADNVLSGAIPSGLTSLAPATGSLTYLGVCNNYLTGAVPTALRTMYAAAVTGSPVYDPVGCQYSGTAGNQAIASLDAAGCTDGTFVDISVHPRVSGNNNDLAEDCQALVAAQNSWAQMSANNRLPSGHSLRSWGAATTQHISTWPGVTVSSGRVTTLNLANTTGQGITGTFPAEIGNLTALTSLTAQSNRFTGSIPTQLGSLTALTSLDLSGNRFSGSIPTQLGSLTALTSLDLSGNSLANAIPSQLTSLTALTSLDLSDNALTGSIPTGIGSLTALTNLDLGGNSLSSTIPSGISSLTALTNLDLGGNALSGSIPSGISSLTSLTSLDLSGNALTGSIPTGISSLTSLVSLYLSANRLQGSVPTQLATLVPSDSGSLATLAICANELTGALPTALRTGVTLTDYPTASGYDPIACQREPSDITFSNPAAISLLPGTSIVIDASVFATDGSYTISCGDATGIDATRLSVARTTGTCLFTVTATALTGAASFTVLYTSSGRDTHSGVIRITVGAPPALGSSGCTDGNFVDLSANPRASGLNNDLAEDCLALVAIRNAWTSQASNAALPADHPLRSWGTTAHKITSWPGVTVSGGRVTGLDLGYSEAGSLATKLAGSLPSALGSLTALTSLDLSGHRFSGGIPASLGSLASLASLDLSGNSLSGGIPSQIAGINSLATLDLSDNLLTGSIPASIGGSSSALASLDLSANRLIGLIPASLGQAASLASLDLSQNNLSGGIPNLGSLASLTTLRLNFNQLSGAIPQSLSSLAALVTLDLSNNRLSGAIPSQLGALPASASPPGSLAAFSVCGNRLSGNVPAALRSDSQQPARYIIDVQGNYEPIGCQITGSAAAAAIAPLSPAGCTDGTFVNTTDNPRVTGVNNDLVEDCLALVAIQNHWAAVSANEFLEADNPLRTWGTGASAAAKQISTTGTGQSRTNTWAGVTVSSGRVTALNLSGLTGYGISGSIPSQLGSLSGLTELDLSSNRFTVGIPSELGSLASLTVLDIQDNRLTGSIPARLGSLASLTELNLGANDLTGSIPSEFSGLTSVAVLDLSYNRLSGSIPAGLGSMTALEEVLLNDNRLSGSIPAELGDLSSVIEVDLAANRLTGSIPTELGNMAGLEVLYLSDNRLSGAIPSALGDLSELNELDLSNNRLTGSIPASLNDLSEEVFGYLYSLGICGNYLTGGVPSDLQGLLSLYPGNVYNPVACQRTPSISFTAPVGLTVAAGKSVAINAAGYAAEEGFAITCTAASEASALISIASRNGCRLQVSAGSSTGTATITVSYSSGSGATRRGIISLTVSAAAAAGASSISFTAPTGLTMPASTSLVVNAASYASDGSFTITCGTATAVDAKITLAQSGCLYTLTAAATTGAASFTVPYTSSGGSTQSGTISVTITAASSISFTAPANLAIGIYRTRTINALDYATDGTYTITCGDATGIDSKISSIVRDASGDGCTFTINPTATQGAAAFTIPYSSSGGSTLNAAFSINIGPVSNIAFTAPTGLTVGRNRTLAIDASDHVADGSYTFTCADATGVDASKMTVTHTGSSCAFTVDPVDSLAPANQGDTTFSVVITSAGGSSTTGTFTVNIGPDSTITFTAPTNLYMAASGNLVIDASDYVTEVSPAAYTISCGDATSITSARFSSVARSTSGDGCSFTVTATSSTGDGNFTVPYTSSGGSTVSGQFTVSVTTISYTAPANLSVVAGRNTIIAASGYVTDGSNTFTCADATGQSITDGHISVSRNNCFFTVTAATSAAGRNVAFTTVVTSSGGGSRPIEIPLAVTAVSDITFTAPVGGVNIGAGNSKTIDVSSYATDGTYTIQCRFEESGRHARITSVTTDGCNFTVRAGNTQGSATLSVLYNSSGGDETTGVITLNIGPSSVILFNVPAASSLPVVAGGAAATVNAGSYVSDGSYTISCGDATAVSATISVQRTGCSFAVTAQASASGTVSFAVPYTSDGGNARSGTIRMAVSKISYAAPVGLSVASQGIFVLDASDYASDGNFTISCGTATIPSFTERARITSITRTGCSYEIRAANATGSVDIRVPYTSTGGATNSGTVRVSVGDILALSSTDCSNGTFVNTTDNPRVSGADNDLVEDCEALVAMYQNWRSTAANSNLRSSYFVRTWGAGTASQRLVENWEGVTVSSGRITGLDLENFGEEDGVSGTIHSTIGDLNALTSLNIAGHQLSGSIPSEVYSLTSLTELDLSENSLSGTLSTSLGSLTALTNLILSGNSISGGIPTQISSLTALTALDLGSNSLTGRIPTGIGSLTSLTQLDLSSNSLEGSIPTQLGSLTALTSLLLSGNSFTGSIPTQLGSLTALTLLSLNNNSLTGSIPTQLGSLTNLVALYINNNRLQGSVPSQLGTLTTANSGKLAALGICANELTGALPTALRTGVMLVGYPVGDGFNPIACQRDPSNVVFTAPTGLAIGRNFTLAINASEHVSEHASYTVSCADATGVDATKMTVTRSSTGDGCTFTVDPVDTLTPANQGDATFSVLFTSTGGDTATGTFTVNIGPDSSITYTAPANLFVVASGTLVIDAAAHAADGSYTITCGDATGISSTRFSSVVRSAAGNGCSFTVTATASTGDGNFTVPFTSSGGSTANGQFTVSVTTISYNAPTGLSVAAGRGIAIGVSGYVSDGANTITCSAATSQDITDGHITVSRNGCTFTITAGASAAGENVVVTVPVTSSGGGSRTVDIAIAITAASSIVFTDPAGGVNIGAGNSKTIDVGSFATDGTYTIQCRFNESSRHTRIVSVTTDGCNFTVRAGTSQGSATLSVLYNSSGGDETTGVVSLNIGPSSALLFTAPSVSSLSVAAGGSATTVDASSYVTDGSYTISCGDATSVSATISVQRTGCSFAVTAQATASGIVSFTVPYTSDGGNSRSGTIRMTVSKIAYSGPTGFSMAAQGVLEFDASDYASDGSFTITCGAATIPRNRRASQNHQHHPVGLRLHSKVSQRRVGGSEHTSALHLQRRGHPLGADTGGCGSHLSPQQHRLLQRHLHRHSSQPQSVGRRQRSGGRLRSPGSDARELARHHSQQQPAQQLFLAHLGHRHGL